MIEIPESLLDELANHYRLMDILVLIKRISPGKSIAPTRLRDIINELEHWQRDIESRIRIKIDIIR